MKNAIVCLLIIFSCINIYAQKGAVIQLGYSKLSFVNEEYLSSKQNTNTVFVAMDYVPHEVLLLSFEINKNFNTSEVDYFDLRIKGGVILNNTSRFQFPVFLSFNIYSLREKNPEKKFGEYSFSLKAGLRYYITNNFSLNAGIDYSLLPITRIDDDTFNKSLGNIKGSGLYLGIGHYFSSNKN